MKNLRTEIAREISESVTFINMMPEDVNEAYVLVRLKELVKQELIREMRDAVENIDEFYRV